MLFVGGKWKTLGVCTRKAVGHFKQDLTGHHSMSTEDNAKGSLNCGGPDQEVSEGKSTISKWPRDHSCDILAWNVVALCPCLKKICLRLN